MPDFRVVEFEDGIAICGQFPSDELIGYVRNRCGLLPLVICDPPYGRILNVPWDRVNEDDRQFCDWMIHWTNKLEPCMTPASALYVWGGIGKSKESRKTKEKPSFRPFFRYLCDVENRTEFAISTLITWKKKRAYGVQWGYLFTREECVYLVLGDPKKPRKFTVPLLAKERGYEGYNKRYPAKSKFLRRTNVWDDITEILRGKRHIAEKPSELAEIMIEAHTEPGEWVCDPFAGSGSTAEAARALGRRFVVVERDAKEFEKLVANLRRAA